MKKYGFIAFFVAIVTAIITALSPVAALAEYDAPYVALGADLTAEQRTEVLNLLGVSESELTEDTMLTITNEDERRYLGGIVADSLIGSKALSSCKVVKQKEGYGIKVETHNINGISASMFQSALATAGMRDALVVVAAPYEISGTAALLGAMQAYAKTSGSAIRTELITGALKELTTSELIAEVTGDPEKVIQVVAAAKQIVLSGDIEDRDDLAGVVRDLAGQMNLNLSENQSNQIVALMEEFTELELDPDEITSQVRSIYQAAKSSGLDLSKYGLSESTVNGFLDRLPGLIRALMNWLRGIFGKN